MLDDSKIVTNILNGNLGAFKILVQNNEKLVFHIVRILIPQQQEDVEDLCQEIFIKVYKKLPAFRNQSKISTWIASIAYRTTLNYIKKRKIETIDLSDSHLNDQFTQSPETELIQGDERKFVRDQINQLPTKYKTILILYHLDDMSYKEIEDITGLPEGTVKSYLFRARKLLKEQLTKYVNRDGKII